MKKGSKKRSRKSRKSRRSRRSRKFGKKQNPYEKKFDDAFERHYECTQNRYDCEKLEKKMNSLEDKMYDYMFKHMTKEEKEAIARNRKIIKYGAGIAGIATLIRYGPKLKSYVSRKIT